MASSFGGISMAKMPSQLDTDSIDKKYDGGKGSAFGRSYKEKSTPPSSKSTSFQSIDRSLNPGAGVAFNSQGQVAATTASRAAAVATAVVSSAAASSSPSFDHTRVSPPITIPSARKQTSIESDEESDEGVDEGESDDEIAETSTHAVDSDEIEFSFQPKLASQFESLSVSIARSSTSTVASSFSHKRPPVSLQGASAIGLDMLTVDIVTYS